MHRRLEDRLVRSVDHVHPDDGAIGAALQIAAEDQEYEGRDRIALIHRACKDGLISYKRRNLLLRIERWYLAQDVISAAVDIVHEYPQWAYLRREPGFRVSSERVWRDDLDVAEMAERRRLEEARYNGGLTAEDRATYETLTRYQLPERPRLADLPAELSRQAHARVRDRMPRARGEMPRSRPISRTNRSRMKTYETPSLSKQLGRLATEKDEREIRRLAAELRRQAKAHGDVPPQHDRRRVRQGR